jgi:two-component system response regulator YesN
MPGMNGWSLAQQIKDKSPNTPVVLMTGSREETVEKKSLRPCVDAVMFKPFKLKEMLEMVLTLLDTNQESDAGEGQKG